MVDESRREEGKASAVLSDSDYSSLARFRYSLRRFLAFSESEAKAHGIAPSQHQLLLAVRGFGGESSPSVSQLAELLQLKTNSAGELIDRAIDNGFLQRDADPKDHRRSLISLTSLGQEKLELLSVIHKRELRRFRTELHAILNELED